MRASIPLMGTAVAGCTLGIVDDTFNAEKVLINGEPHFAVVLPRGARGYTSEEDRVSLELFPEMCAAGAQAIRVAQPPFDSIQSVEHSDFPYWKYMRSEFAKCEKPGKVIQ